MNPVRFSVYGQGQPKGSIKMLPIRKFPFTVHSFKELMKSVILTSDNSEVKRWQKDIARAAQLALGGVQLEIAGAIAIEAVFYLPRPKSHPKSATGPHITRPDVDKLARAVADAITGTVWHDDGQVTDLIARKRYAETPAQARVDVTITPIAVGLPLFSDTETRGTHVRTVAAANRGSATPAAVDRHRAPAAGLW